MAIDRKYIKNLGGRDYPMWGGVLDAATKSGLKSITTTIVQIPSPENGNMAVVLARAEFEDGRVFEDVGDCSPASTKPQLAAAALRMASTRAKGRALRDALNVGETMFEELPDEDSALPASRLQAGDPEVHEVFCANCGVDVEWGYAQSTRRKAGRYLCPECSGKLEVHTAQPVASYPKPPEGALQACARCSKPVTLAQAKLSTQKYGSAACPACQRELAKLAAA